MRSAARNVVPGARPRSSRRSRTRLGSMLLICLSQALSQVVPRYSLSVSGIPGLARSRALTSLLHREAARLRPVPPAGVGAQASARPPAETYASQQRAFARQAQSLQAPRATSQNSPRCCWRRARKHAVGDADADRPTFTKAIGPSPEGPGHRFPRDEDAGALTGSRPRPASHGDRLRHSESTSRQLAWRTPTGGPRGPPCPSARRDAGTLSPNFGCAASVSRAAHRRLHERLRPRHGAWELLDLHQRAPSRVGQEDEGVFNA